jgi:hypothetical protein
MNYTQLLEARGRRINEEENESFVASKDGVLFHNWEEFDQFPTANDSGGKRKKKLW